MNYFSNRLEYLDKLEDYWKDDRYKNNAYETYRKRKHFFDRLVTQFKSKTVVIGKYKNIKRMKYGKKKPPIQYFINYCIRNHIKIKVFTEFNTSKLCCQCGFVLRNYNAATKQAQKYINARLSKFSKLKYCESASCEHVIDRDVNASINIGRVFDYESNHNELPNIFDPKKDKFNKT